MPRVDCAKFFAQARLMYILKEDTGSKLCVHIIRPFADIITVAACSKGQKMLARKIYDRKAMSKPSHLESNNRKK
jgi:hypothetical protein